VKELQDNGGEWSRNANKCAQNIEIGKAEYTDIEM
jgi:hypothetical protein